METQKPLIEENEGEKNIFEAPKPPVQAVRRVVVSNVKHGPPTPNPISHNHPRDPANPEKPVIRSIMKGGIVNSTNEIKEENIELSETDKVKDKIATQISKMVPCTLCGKIDAIFVIRCEDGNVCPQCIAKAVIKISTGKKK